MITEDYVSFETAKLLKEKGFDEYCLKNYWSTDKELHNWGWELSYHRNSDGNRNTKDCVAPTLQMAMKWLREIYDLHIIAYPWRANKEERATHWCCRVYKSFNLFGYEKYTNETPESYEEACEAAIKYCLENLI
jgi:hypothetical protein